MTGMALIAQTFATLRAVLFVTLIAAAVVGLTLAALTPGEHIVGSAGYDNSDVIIAAPIDYESMSMAAF